jgi:peptidyl-prolyl cis-trans isomerase A (cyclophilin A)/peptidyl-prolyl cis-trans isomerase B (cyclophilin B)
MKAQHDNNLWRHSKMKTVFLALSIALLLAQGAFAANPSYPEVELKTSLGKITLELYPDKAPKTVENFLEYVKSGHYNGTIFHRVIAGFMIQGGGFDANFNEKPTRAPIANESDNGLKNNIGTVAMARTSDPNSATAQFFVNVADNDFLNRPGQDGWGYCVFGKVIKGMDVVNKIAAVPTGSHPPYDDVPLSAVLIESVKLLPAER